MDLVRREILKFGHPTAYIVSFRIPPLGLSPGIEDAEKGLCIRTGGRRPLPAPVVARRIAVDKVLEKEPFA